MYPLEQHLLRTRQRHKAVAQRLKKRVGDRLELLDEVVLIVNARMPGLQRLGTALRHHVLDQPPRWYCWGRFNFALCASAMRAARTWGGTLTS